MSPATSNSEDLPIEEVKTFGKYHVNSSRKTRFLTTYPAKMIFDDLYKVLSIKDNFQKDDFEPLKDQWRLTFKFCEAQEVYSEDEEAKEPLNSYE